MLAATSTIVVMDATTPTVAVLALELSDEVEAEVSLSVALALALVLLLVVSLVDAELEVSAGMVTVGSVLLELLPLLSVDVMVTVASLALDAVNPALGVDVALVLALDAVVVTFELVLDVVGAVVTALPVEAEVAAALALDAVEVVLVLADESLDSAAHLAEKPFTISYTLITRPLVGTVSAQSGGSSSMIDEMSD